MDTKKEIMSIVQEDGSIDEVEVLVSFEFTDTKKAYVVYTKNEVDDRGNIGKRLGGVETDEEWTRIKEVLRKLAKEGQE